MPKMGAISRKVAEGTVSRRGESELFNVKEHAMLSLLITARKLIALRRRCVLPPPRVFVNIKGTINLFLSNCSHERERSGWKATNLFPLAPTLSNNFYISVQMIFVRMNDTFVSIIQPSNLYQNLLPYLELLNPRYMSATPPLEMGQILWGWESGVER